MRGLFLAPELRNQVIVSNRLITADRRSAGEPPAHRTPLDWSRAARRRNANEIWVALVSTECLR
jgi:hypothetical protein